MSGNNVVLDTNTLIFYVKKGFSHKTCFPPPNPSKWGDNTLKTNRLSPFGGVGGRKRVNFTDYYLIDYQTVSFL